MNRLARIALALTITSAIGMQIPAPNGIAMAQNENCGGNNNNAGKILGLKQGTFATAVIVSLIIAAETIGEEKTPADVTAMVDSSMSPSNASSASLLEVSSGTARELIAKCPTLSQQLASEGPFTMFLPSDEALASVKLEGAALETFLKRHIVLGRYSYSDLSGLSNGAKLQTLAETELAVSHNESGEVLVGGEIVPNEARSGSNGFSYSVKNVLP